MLCCLYLPTSGYENFHTAELKEFYSENPYVPHLNSTINILLLTLSPSYTLSLVSYCYLQITPNIAAYEKQ